MPSQQAGAVTASAIGIHAAAMRQPDQGLERAVHDLARSASADLRDQADTAGVVVCGEVTRTHLYIVYRQ